MQILFTVSFYNFNMEVFMTLDQLSNLVKDPKLFGILIVRPFGLLLQWLYSIVQNYGIAVILFALLVKLVCIPLTIKSKKSMLAMSAMNAELQQLQKKYATTASSSPFSNICTIVFASVIADIPLYLV